MIRRFRSATALLALITLFAHAAGGAATLLLCTPAGAAADASYDIEPGAHAQHDAPMPASDHGGSHAPDQNQCPPRMAASGSCAAASLPATSIAPQVPTLTAAYTWATGLVPHEDGPIRDLFHPPRA